MMRDRQRIMFAILICIISIVDGGQLRGVNNTSSTININTNRSLASPAGFDCIDIANDGSITPKADLSQCPSCFDTDSCCMQANYWIYRYVITRCAIATHVTSFKTILISSLLLLPS